MSTINNNEKVYLFHGTSYNRYLDIKENGFGSYGDKELVWDCSDGDMTYFYEMERLCESEGREDDNLEDKINFCLERANESGRITASLESNPQNRTMVFMLTVNKDIIEKYMESDDSCEGMDYMAVTVPSDILNDFIKKGLIKVEVVGFEFNPKFSLFYLGCIYKNRCAQNAFDSLSCEEKTVLKVFSENGIFIDDVFYCTERVEIE